MLGDVGQPDLVGPLRREVTPHVVIVNGRSGTFGAFRALRKRAEDLLLGTDPPHSSFTRSVAGVGEHVGDEAVAKDRVIEVRVDRSVGEVGVLEVAWRHGTAQPAVVVLGGELQDPTRHRDGEPVSGQLADERVFHFGLKSLAK